MPKPVVQKHARGGASTLEIIVKMDYNNIRLSWQKATFA